MDYIYTAFHQASIDGTPVLNPLWYKYPQDPTTFPIDLQFLFGSSILVSPITEENATSVSAYLPNDIFYDFNSLAPLRGKGSYVEFTEVNLTSIPIHIRGGAVLPLRAQGAMTTAALRQQDFELVIAPGLNGEASGSLYLDDGVSITPATKTELDMAYQNGTLIVSGTFAYDSNVTVSRVLLLNVQDAPHSAQLNGQPISSTPLYDTATGVLSVSLNLPLNQNFTLRML